MAPIEIAASRLDASLSACAALRESLGFRIPLPAAEARLDHLEDLLAIVSSQLHAAYDLVEAQIATSQELNRRLRAA
jgi:hypothetical protein